MPTKPDHFLCDCDRRKKAFSFKVSLYTLIFKVLLIFTHIIFMEILFILPILDYYFYDGRVELILSLPNDVSGSCIAEKPPFLSPDYSFSVNPIIHFTEELKQCKAPPNFFWYLPKVIQYLKIKHKITPKIRNELKGYGSVCYANEIVIPLIHTVMLVVNIHAVIIMYYSIKVIYFNPVLKPFLFTSRIPSLTSSILTIAQIIVSKYVIEEIIFLGL